MVRKRLIRASTIAYAVAIPLSFPLIFFGLEESFRRNYVSLSFILLILASILILPPIIIQSRLLRGRAKARKIALSAGISAILGGLLGGLASDFGGWFIVMPIFASLVCCGIGPAGAGGILVLLTSAIAGAIIGFLSAIPPILKHREALTESEKETGNEEDGT